MAAESRRPHLRFSEVLDETESDVTTNPSAKEDGSHGLQDEEGEEEEEEEDEEEDLQHKTKSVDDANFLSKLFWCWLDPLFCTGLRSELHREHLRLPPKSAESQRLQEQFQKYWSREKSKGRSPKLLTALFRILWPKVLLNLLLAALKLILSMGLAILVGQLAEYFVTERTAEQTRDAYLYSMGLTLAILLSAFVHNHGFLQAQEIGMLSRIVTSGAIFQKSLQLNQKKMGKLTIGKVLNLAAADAGSLDFAFLYTPYLVLAPLHVLAVLVLLWLYIGLGPSCLAGLGLFILWIPMQLVLSKVYAALRIKAVKCTDSRVRAMTDILSGIKVLKMYAWENVFKKLIFNIRRKEIKYITVSALFRASNDGFFLVFIALFNLFTFVTYTLTTGNPLTPNIVFTSFTLITGLRLSTIVYMVEGVLGFQQARVALHRIQELLDITVEAPSTEEHSSDGDNSTDGIGTIKACNGTANLLPILQNPTNGTTLRETKRPIHLKIPQEEVLSVLELGASWAAEDEVLTLSDISFTVKRGEVFTIVGPVGNGKSSLLQAILGEMGTYQGSVTISGTVAYTSQEPWVFGGTLRENVLCGREFREDWYWKVIEACSLKEDLEEFTLGDFNQVGEHGLSLSGGQRSRVNLARAVYGEANLYLLDDPLSAVDPQVEHHLFEECIRKLLKKSAVVLVTHQLPIAQLSDKVMVLKEGKVVAQGTFEDIVDMATVEEENPTSVILKDVLSNMLEDGDEEEEEEEEEMHELHALDAIAEEEEEQDDVFTDHLPTVPPVCTTPCKPRVFPSKPKLMRRVTDMDLMRRRSIVPNLLSPAVTPKKRPTSKFGLPCPSSPRTSRLFPQRDQATVVTSQPVQSVSPHDRMRRLSQVILRRPAPLLRSQTVAEFGKRRQSTAFQSRPSVSSQAAFAPRIERDPDQYDYTSVAGLAGLRASAHLRFCADSPSSNLATPSRAKPPLQRRKTMVTMLADQIPEEDSDEDSDHDEAVVEEEKPESSKGSPSPLEDKGHGRITVKTYISYLYMGSSYLLAALIVALFLVSQANIVVAEWWLSEWAQANAMCKMDSTGNTTMNSTGNTTMNSTGNTTMNSTGNTTMNNSSVAGTWLCDFSTEQLAGIYAGLVGSAMILSFARAILFFYVCVRAAKKLHNKMFTAVLRVPMRFFDVNPIGRILNRFSKDIGFLDDILPNTFYDYLTIMLQFLSIMIVSGVANYYIFIVMVFVIAAFILLRWYYLHSSREVKRLEAVARSPLFSHIATTLTGLPTIRSLKRQQMSLEWYHTLQDDHTTGWNSYIASTRWFGLRVDAIGALFVGIVAFMAIPLADIVQSSLIGLSLAYCVSLAGVFQYGVRLSTEVESLMVSVERLMAYGKLPPEAPLETTPAINKPSKDWPKEGSIKLRELKFRYSAEDPLVLKGITCNIASSEKIGVIGRSGAGKSSLLTALFRIAEPEGVLEIDGVQITDIGLHDLRSKISIIPQDPFLFHGSIRENLDPLEQYTDEEMWTALEKVDMKEAMQQSPAKLLTTVTEGGGNFSAGQRQLICLARAILRKDKVLVIDEATANVDMATDAIIQQTLRTEFDQCTVLTIAHRLHTIMDYDRIMVLGAGKLKEMDEPYTLLKTSGSLLSDMVSQVGNEEAAKLEHIAFEAHKKLNKRRMTG